MATLSSNLDWKIPWTEEPGGLQSVGTQSDTTEQLNNKNNIQVLVVMLNDTSLLLQK